MSKRSIDTGDAPAEREHKRSRTEPKETHPLSMESSSSSEEDKAPRPGDSAWTCETMPAAVASGEKPIMATVKGVYMKAGDDIGFTEVWVDIRQTATEQQYLLRGKDHEGKIVSQVLDVEHARYVEFGEDRVLLFQARPQEVSAKKSTMPISDAFYKRMRADVSNYLADWAKGDKPDHEVYWEDWYALQPVKKVSDADWIEEHFVWATDKTPGLAVPVDTTYGPVGARNIRPPYNAAGWRRYIRGLPDMFAKHRGLFDTVVKTYPERWTDKQWQALGMLLFVLMDFHRKDLVEAVPPEELPVNRLATAFFGYKSLDMKKWFLRGDFCVMGSTKDGVASTLDGRFIELMQAFVTERKRGKDTAA